MKNKSASLTPQQISIIQDKKTEYPFSGKYNDLTEAGTYLCRRCGVALFRGKSKFHSHCGWPSFDEEISGTVKHEPDADHYRTEILCTRCDAHLGHIFQGEGLTQKNLRYCVNSASLDFVSDQTVQDTEEAIFAAGCFWGVEYYFKKLSGVLKTEVGYSGGTTLNPTYEQVCGGDTSHFEVIRVIYDPKKINYETLTKYFFEIHDFTQLDGQGPDLGHQYLSVIFFYNSEQRKLAEKLIHELQNKNYHVSTQLLPVSSFWPAEDYHQNYYTKTGKIPYCHRYTKIF